MIISRNGEAPQIDQQASIAGSARIVGNVRIGPRAYVDHGVVIESSGPPVEIAAEAVVFAGAIIRSVGGRSRPAFPVRVGERSLVSPLCVLSGCLVGANCYVATGVIVLQGASIGDHVRVGAGAIVHATTAIPKGERVGMRHVAVPTPQGFVTTADVEEARKIIGEIDFFETAFGASGGNQAELHAGVMSTLLEEVHGWRDEQIG